jgi:hypothetical protein
MNNNMLGKLSVEMAFPDMMEIIKHHFDFFQNNRSEVVIPVTFFQKIIATRSLNIIDYTVEDMLALLAHYRPVRTGEQEILRAILATNKLDQIYVLCHERCADHYQAVRETVGGLPGEAKFAELVSFHRAEAQRLKDWLASKVVKNDPEDVQLLQRTLMGKGVVDRPNHPMDSLLK